MLKNLEYNRTVEIGLVTPTPWEWGLVGSKQDCMHVGRCYNGVQLHELSNMGLWLR